MATGPENLRRYLVRDRKRRWRSREEFAAHAGVGKRTVDRLERAEVHAYSDTTKARIEAALSWTDGSIDRVLNGGRPSYLRDAELAELTDLWPSLSRDAKRMLISLARGAITPR